MVKFSRRRRSGRAESCIAVAYRTHPAIGRTLRHHLTPTRVRRCYADRPRGGTPEEDGGSVELKPGYKHAEVGVIPENWEVRTLGAITTLLTNGFVGKAKDYYVESDDGVLYVQGYNVQENGFNLHGIRRVSKRFHATHQKSCLQTGDLLTIQTGDIGTTAVVPPTLAGANCHALVISRFKNQHFDPN